MDLKAEILLIDDDEDALLSLSRVLKSLLPHVIINGASTAAKGLQLLEERNPATIVMDLCLDERIGPASGFELIQNILSKDPNIRIIVLTGYGSVESGVKCLSLGAANFLEKPPEPAHLAALIKDGIAQNGLKKAFAELKNSSDDLLRELVVGDSDQAKKVRDEILYAAQTNQAVFITGETGTGKGLCATAIHKFSKRSSKKLVRYQPSLGASELVSSELFGHWKGAFTGAETARTGLIEEAHGGTLFLDEVDELPLEIQVTLLGVLQDKKVRRLGGNNEFEADFRLIAATNQNIEEKIKEKKVRADFYHRIGHLQIHLPPLRERIDDIKCLAEKKLKELQERESINIFGLSVDALKKLRDHQWLGNIRELEAVIEGAAYKARYLNLNSISANEVVIRGSHTSSTNNSLNKSFQEQVEEFKIKVIEEALKKNSGNQVQTAKELGMERSTLRRIVERNKF
jgi:two-component system response regulator AtoC